MCLTIEEADEAPHVDRNDEVVVLLRKRFKQARERRGDRVPRQRERFGQSDDPEQPCRKHDRNDERCRAFDRLVRARPADTTEQFADDRCERVTDSEDQDARVAIDAATFEPQATGTSGQEVEVTDNDRSCVFRIEKLGKEDVQGRSDRVQREEASVLDERKDSERERERERRKRRLQPDQKASRKSGMDEPRKRCQAQT